MQSQSPSQIELMNLVKEYDNLTARRFAITEQIIGETCGDQKITLENRKKLISEQITTVWERMKELNEPSLLTNRRFLDFKENLPKIDFQEAVDEIDNILRSINKGDRGDILILIQESLRFSGNLFLQRIHDDLRRSTCEGNFNYQKIGFHSGDELNEYAWLEKIAVYFDCSIVLDPMILANAVIEKICQSTRSASILFLEIHKWDELPCQEKTLAWFLKNFWIPLVSRLDNREKYKRVKFIAVVVAGSKLEYPCFQEPCLCETVQFRWREIFLRNWTKDEIQSWIEDYAQVQSPRSETLSQSIFRASDNGIPRLVRSGLEDEFLQQSA
jgi:hypothetical protein